MPEELYFSINGRKYKGYSDYWFHYEQVMETEPERSAGNGAMTNINDINRFYVPHLWIDFAYMDLKTFRQFEIDTQPVEMLISCTDPVSGEIVTHKMYLAPKQRRKLRFYGGGYLGVLDTKLEFIGTNNPLNEVVITYMPNGGLGSVKSQSIAQGREFVVQKASTLSKAGYNFTTWNTKPDGTGATYNEDQVAVANFPMTLYAQWITTDQRTLSFDYGEAIVATDNTGKPISKKTVTMNQAVGELPPIEIGTVKYKGKDYTEPYDVGGWNALSNGQGTTYTADTIYTIDGNEVIYAILIPRNITVTFETNGADQQLEPITQPYYSIVEIPTITKQGYKFMGWYEDPQFNFSFWNVMPPINAKIYAKWELI